MKTEMKKAQSQSAHPIVVNPSDQFQSMNPIDILAERSGMVSASNQY
jgi:hypothetical protein